MNRQPLAGLDEDLIRECELLDPRYDDCNYWLRANHNLIIECMRVALRWRNDLDQMKEERG